MQLEKIAVKGLYGLHDYSIELDQSECIKIIHAPNGYGKTTVLKLIKEIIEENILEISIIPFSSFLLRFDNHLEIEVVKKDQPENHLCYILRENGEERQYCIAAHKQSIEELIQHMPMEVIEKNLLFLKQVSQSNLAANEAGQKMGYVISEELDSKLKKIRQEMPIHFINANRLLYTYDDKVGRRKSVTPSVMIYAKELADAIKSVLAKSALNGQKLDSTFPVRLIKVMQDKETKALDIEEIREEIKALEWMRKSLEAMDLLTEGENSVVECLEGLNQDMLKVLALYIQDSKEKLAIFDDIAPRIRLLQAIINKRFAYKTMHISKKEGFVFKVPTGEYLTADKLSSGEQNELVLIYDLLFKSQKNALILMDEPEISLHIAWQQCFLEDIEAITELTGIKVIIATHSPDIINGRWELTTGLEENT